MNDRSTPSALRPLRLAAPVALAAAVAVSALLMLAGPRSPALGAAERPTLTLMTHDSYFLPEDVVASFEETHDVELRVLQAGDAGSMVNQAILSRMAGDRPLADVLYGVDNTFLSRALEADVFQPYRSASLDAVPERFLLDPDMRVTPIDHADVCLNVDVPALEAAGLPVPESLEDLVDPAYRGTLVVQNPATSSPGLSFLLATVAHFGEAGEVRGGDEHEAGWQGYWAALRENDVLVTSGWNDAYYGHFSGGSGEGDRPIVVSYATSPVAEVVFGPDPEADEAPTRALEAGCFRQVEFAGVLAGTQQPELAGALIDHLLSPEVQAELPLAMYVLPVRDDVALPAAFERHALRPAEPLSMDPPAIDASRERWIGEWTDIVLR
ncbi:thiamine ABC transporter substrate-binding protein [soil metagenome]